MDQIANFVDLTNGQLIFCAIAAFAAGLVRGFSGFLLSAMIMASVVVILPPIVLVPVCFMLEGVASILMVRGGIRDAHMPTVWGLVIGSATGAPIGLYLTNTLPTETSKLVALFLVTFLAVLQLGKLAPPFLATKPGLYLSGLCAGVVTGLASVGGMVVGLYVLAQDKPAREMRGSLVMYLFLGMFTSCIYLLAYGMLDQLVLKRVLALAPFVIIGVALGSVAFRPSLERFYKQFCLLLLILLALAGIVRTAMGA